MPTRRKLAPYDWDFSSVKDPDELRNCTRYEYYREYLTQGGVGPDIPETMATWKSMMRSKAKHTSSELDSERRQWAEALVLWRFWWFHDIPEFPGKPWLELEESIRSRYRRAREAADETVYQEGFQIKEITPSTALNTQMLFRDSINMGGFFGAFQIVPGFSQTQILQRVKLFLKTLAERQPAIFFNKPGGRGGPADVLRQLTAYRVLSECGNSPERARKFVGNKRAELYDKDNSWTDASDAAKVEIERTGQEAISLYKDIEIGFYRTFGVI